MSGAEKLVEQIIETLNENKGVDIVKIDLRRIENCFCSFFVICHGTSNTHVASLTDFVYDEVNEKLGENHYTWKENNKPSGWCWITEM